MTNNSFGRSSAPCIVYKWNNTHIHNSDEIFFTIRIHLTQTDARGSNVIKFASCWILPCNS